MCGLRRSHPIRQIAGEPHWTMPWQWRQKIQKLTHQKYDQECKQHDHISRSIPKRIKSWNPLRWTIWGIILGKFLDIVLSVCVVFAAIIGAHIYFGVLKYCIGLNCQFTSAQDQNSTILQYSNSTMLNFKDMVIVLLQNRTCVQLGKKLHTKIWKTPTTFVCVCTYARSSYCCWWICCWC